MRYAPHTIESTLIADDNLRIVTRKRDPIMEEELAREKWLIKHVPGYGSGTLRMRKQRNGTGSRKRCQ